MVNFVEKKEKKNLGGGRAVVGVEECLCASDENGGWSGHSPGRM